MPKNGSDYKREQTSLDKNNLMSTDRLPTMQINDQFQNNGNRIDINNGNNMRNQYGNDIRPVSNFLVDIQNNQINQNNNLSGSNNINLNPNIVINPQVIPKQPNQNNYMNNNNLNNNPFGQPFEPEVIISIYF